VSRYQTDTGENINLLGGGNKAGLLVVLDYATVQGHWSLRRLGADGIVGGDGIFGAE